MTSRLPVALALACLVTFGLFWSMQALIGVSGELQEGRSPPTVDFVRLRRDSQIETKKREPPQREKPEQPPPPPDITMSKANLDPGSVGAIMPTIDPGDAIGGGIGTVGGSDRDAVPLVRIEPDYPMRARQRGIEGWVTVEFTISKAGTVVDPVILASEPGTIFDRNAIRAVLKWKYKPKIQNGEAIERPGQQVLFEFSMEDE
jgi:protein TonB